MNLLTTYDQAIRFLCQAGRAIVEQREPEARQCGSSTIAVLARVIRAIQDGGSGGWNSDLEHQHGFLVMQIDRAIDGMDIEALEEALEQLNQLRQGWGQVLRDRAA